MNKLAKYNKHLVSSFLTILVLSVLLLLGPASAVSLSVAVSDSEVDEGEQVTFSLNVDVDSGERIPFQNFTLEILDSGSLVDSCTFAPSGALISCDNESFSVASLIASGSYGYGYGYGYGLTNSGNVSTAFGYGYGYGYGASVSGELQYNVTWTTPSLTEQTTYTARLAGVATGSSTVEYISGNEVEVTVNNVETTTATASTGGGSGVATSTVSARSTIADVLGIPAGDIQGTSFQGSDDYTFEAVEITEALLAGLEDEPREALEAFRDENGLLEADVELTTTTYEVTFADGTEQTYTFIELEVDLGDADGPVTVAFVIPKSVLETASGILGDEFTVLADDPVIAFTTTGGSTEVFSFALPANANADVFDVVIGTPLTEVVEETPVVIPAVPTPEPVVETTEDDFEQAPGLGGFVIANAPTFVGVLVALLIIVLIGYFALRGRRTDEAEEQIEEMEKEKAAPKKTKAPAKKKKTSAKKKAE